jgi:hypothetical protein
MVSRIDLKADVRHCRLAALCYGRRVGAIRSRRAYPDILCTVSTSSHYKCAITIIGELLACCERLSLLGCKMCVA